MTTNESAKAFKNDRLLVAIVVGIILLVVVTFILVLSQPEPTFQSDETAEGVTHNYLLALRKEDFERAYSYLSPGIAHYPPDVESFVDDIEGSYPWVFRPDEEVSFAIVSSRASGSRVFVTVEESRFSGGNLFESGRRERTFRVQLRLDDGHWRIHTSEAYWANCWSDDSSECR